MYILMLRLIIFPEEKFNFCKLELGMLYNVNADNTFIETDNR